MIVLEPRSAAEAVALISRPGHAAVAGGTALQVLWSGGTARPDALVSLAQLDLTAIDADPDGPVRIGAAVTLAALERSTTMARAVPLLARALRDVAAPSVRRLATLGGQVGWGGGCLLPALLALGARLAVTDADGPHEITLEAWLKAPTGLIRWIEVPQQDPNTRWCWRKVGLRAAFSPAIVVVAGLHGPAGTRLAAGGGAVRAQLLHASAANAARHGPDALRAAVAGELDAPDCAFRSAAYRRRVAGEALAHGLFDPSAQHTPTPPLAQPASAAASSSAPTAPSPVAAPPGWLDPAPNNPRWYPRAGMPDRIAARAPYLTDRRIPGMLIGRILRAGRPHARIVSLETAQAEAMPGVRAVVTHRDIAGLNGFGIMRQDQPALCSDRVRYEGDAVAAVAAVDAETADAALAAIRVVYEDLPAVTDPAAALEPDAPQVHAGGNLVCDFTFDRGDVEAGFAAAQHVVEDTYVTPRQMHVFLETEGGWAAPAPGGGLVVAVGGQHGGRDRMQLSRITGLPEDQIRVITSPVGGGFGGKDDLTVQPALALLALKAAAPVRLHLSRAESVLAGVKRNPMTIRMRTACDAQGRLVAQDVSALADCGAYASLSPAVLETALEHAVGPYLVDNLRSRGQLAYTNNGTCGAFRGFGANQMTYAIETQMDRLAALAGLDPVAIRRRNLRRPGMPGLMGHAVAGSERLTEMLDAAAASPLWADTGALTGTGMALNLQGNGLGSLPHDAGEGLLRLAPDGMIEIACGMDELGQGLVPALQSAVAASLGCARADVRPVFGDTATAPDAGSTTASRGTFVAWTVATRAGPGFGAKLRDLAARRLGCQPCDVRIVPGGFAESARNAPTPLLRFADLAGQEAEKRVAFKFPKTDYTRGNARFIHCYGATLARVAVDAVTGTVCVTDLEMHTAAGPVLDLAAYLGQIEGGMVQGLGLTLTEDVTMAKGRVVTRNLDSYMVPGIRDVPRRMVVTALEDLDPADPWGPRGVGELGIGAVTPAIANAVGAALGHWPAVAPFPPETILDMIAAAGRAHEGVA